MQVTPGITFDDALLAPKYSPIPSRSDIDLSVDLGKGIKLEIPIVSANMKNVTETRMTEAISDMYGLALIHRFHSAHRQGAIFKKTTDSKWIISALGEHEEINPAANYVGCSIGVNEEDKANAAYLISELGCKIICIDVAHGDHEKCVRMTEHIAKTYPEVLLISGNVATGPGALRLHNAGADVIKVGVGGGSLCTTRIETGNGVPQLTALDDCYQASDPHEYRDISKFSNIDETKGWEFVTEHNMDFYRRPKNRRFKIIADGGIRRAGDIVKALCFADAVMLGNMLAGTDEAPGDIITIDGKEYKEYRGSSTYKNTHVEGVSAIVPCKGQVGKIISSLLQGVRSGLSYQGVRNLTDLKVDPQFISVSQAGLKESHPHDIVIR